GEYFVDGRRSTFIRRRPGAVLFVPAGCILEGWEEGASTAAYLSISVEQTFLQTLAGRLPSERIRLLSPDLGFEDPIIMRAARGIGNEIGERSPMGTLLVENYATSILAQLLRRLSYTPRVSKGGLPPATLNRLLEKINAELASDMPLSLLAEIAGLSIPHFCRAFKQSIGYPPHAYIYRLRIERTKEYLRQSSMPITEIALACGFSSLSHLSSAFRREVGITPIGYRLTWPKQASE
ncbi:AraC family transcriptional regulator, partial [Sinorhizobium meliloti]